MTVLASYTSETKFLFCLILEADADINQSINWAFELFPVPLL